MQLWQEITLVLSVFVSSLFPVDIRGCGLILMDAAPVGLEWMLHPILLAGWGTPIGELFDLEALAETCKRRNRWSFFITSVPLNYRGAVASPPNAMAIF